MPASNEDSFSDEVDDRGLADVELAADLETSIVPHGVLFVFLGFGSIRRGSPYRWLYTSHRGFTAIAAIAALGRSEKSGARGTACRCTAVLSRSAGSATANVYADAPPYVYADRRGCCDLSAG